MTGPTKVWSVRVESSGNGKVVIQTSTGTDKEAQTTTLVLPTPNARDLARLILSKADAADAEPRSGKPKE